MVDGIDSGALGPAGRFQRIEETLLRIETKLDSKADAEHLRLLEDKVNKLEVGDTPFAKIYLEQFKQFGDKLNEIDSQGSRQARETEVEVRGLTNRLRTLEETAIKNKALAEDAKVNQQKVYKKVGFMVGVFTLVNITINILTATGILAALAPFGLLFFPLLLLKNKPF